MVLWFLKRFVRRTLSLQCFEFWGRGSDRHPYLPIHKETDRFKEPIVFFIKEICDLITLNYKRVSTILLKYLRYSNTPDSE